MEWEEGLNWKSGLKMPKMNWKGGKVERWSEYVKGGLEMLTRQDKGTAQVD